MNPCVVYQKKKKKPAYLQVLSVNEEKHRLVRIVDNNSSLVLSAQYMQKLFFIVTVMKLKFGLRNKTFTCNYKHVTLPKTSTAPICKQLCSPLW